MQIPFFTRRSGTRRIAELLVAALVAAFLASVLAGWRRIAAEGAPQTAKARALLTASEIQTLRSLGKAYYEQGKYQDAADAFSKVVASGRAVALDHLDLAQALIQTNQLNRALEELTTADEMAPRNLAVHYNLGILYKHELRYPDAERELKSVIAANPSDPPTWFNLGDVYFAQHMLEPAYEAFRHVVDMGYPKAQNFYVAATFHCFIILNRLKRPADAKKYLAMNMATRNKVPNVSLQYPALEAGQYGEVNIAPPETVAQAEIPSARGVAFSLIHLPGAAAPHQASSVAFTQSQSALSTGLDRADIGYSVATGDFTGKGFMDIYVAVPSAQPRSYLLRNNGDGTFTNVTKQAGVEGRGGSLAAEFVDYNNSGHQSIVVAGLGGLTLYKNNGNGTFADVTKQAGLAGNPCELDTDVTAVDLDNDGLLDLVATVYGDACKLPAGPESAMPPHFPADFTSHIYRNNGDGTFTDISASAGLPSVRGNIRQVLFGDFTNDGYMDLLFLRDDGPPMLFMNQGGDKFVDRTAEAGPALANSCADGGAVADFNHDGNFDLALWGRCGYQVLLNNGHARFEAVPDLPPIKMEGGYSPNWNGAVADLNGDGFADLLVRDSRGRWHGLLNRRGRFQEEPLQFGPVWKGPPSGIGRSQLNLTYRESGFTPAWLRQPGDLDLLHVDNEGNLEVLARQGPAPRWIQVKLEGYKSNKQGIGDIIELKSGNFYDKVLAVHGSTRIFTGNLPKLDVVRVTWPNQVVQNTVDAATDTAVSVKESERLASSCPFLYVWNGKRFVFFTDILGDAPIGELAPDGTYLKPNPQDLIRLGSAIKEKNGQYVFQLTDEMREVDYFDQLRLLAVDHPADEDAYSNEIYSPTPVEPALYLVRKKRFPVSAVDGHGRNILPLIRYADGRYPTDFRRNRILGLAAPHSITLDLGKFPQTSHVALWLQGWVFWTDSNASRALMSNSHLKMTDPYLQVRDKAGKWVTVIPDIGLPSGDRRTMRVDLTDKFLTSDHHIRITTDLCVYWDQIFFTTDESEIKPSFSLPLVSANLHYRGFSAVNSDPNHLRPDEFDYAKLMTHAPWNPAHGPYTRYGSVLPLLVSANNQLVAMSTGDAMTVKFSASGLPPLRPGWKRDFFLLAQGYAKDGEPNTAYARSVKPLPFDSMGNYPPPAAKAPRGPSYERYLKDYQTRPAHDLIPSLAPTGAY